jgi:hypothetical protein
MDSKILVFGFGIISLEIEDYDPENESSSVSSIEEDCTRFNHAKTPTRRQQNKQEIRAPKSSSKGKQPWRPSHLKGGVQKIAVYNPRIWSPLDSPHDELKTPRPPSAPRGAFGSPLARRVATKEEKERLLTIQATKKKILAKYQIVLPKDPLYSVIPPAKIIKRYAGKGQVLDTQTIIPPNSTEWLYECSMRIQEAINLEDKVFPCSYFFRTEN